MSTSAVFSVLLLLVLAIYLGETDAFASFGLLVVVQYSRSSSLFGKETNLYLSDNSKQGQNEQAKQDALLAAINAMYGDKPLAEDPSTTQKRIQSLIENNKVVLFMKGSKFIPQCGFSDTATKILEALEVEYEAVDVLADNSIRQGIKEFSQWPTIPQLYINQEFIGGSDIMINMFESGELQKMLEE